MLIRTNRRKTTTHECNQSLSHQLPGLIRAAASLAALLLITTGIASAQITDIASAESLVPTMPSTCTPQIVQTRLIEWDVEPAAGDMTVGALAVDDRSSSRQSKLLFVTRAAGDGNTRLYRLTPGRGIKKDPAEAKAWDLGSLQTGGLRLRHSDDGRFAFINANAVTFNNVQTAQAGLVAIDTRDNKRITWPDRPLQEHMSDVSVDTRGGGHSVFTAALAYQDETGTVFDGGNGVVQRLRPGQPQTKYVNGKAVVVVPAEVTRWPVGGGAGSCIETSGVGAPCIPGVVVDRRRGHPIFVSEPTFVNKDSSQGAIGEIDPGPVKCPDNPYATCAKVRHWPLPPGTGAPRQILVDDSGRVWGITSNGLLFSLDIDRRSDKAVVTRHNPNPFNAPVPGDLFAVSPDGGTIGFTDAETNEVSVLFPKKVTKTVFPDIRFVKPIPRTINGDRVDVGAEPRAVTPRVTTADGVTYTNPGDGTYVETDVSTGMTSPTGSQFASMAPTGMAPDGARRTGSFFYGVTSSAEGDNRVGHFEVRVEPDRELDERKDDDDYDDDGDDDEYDWDDDDDGDHDDVDPDDDNDCEPDHTDKDKDNDGIENEHDTTTHRENKRIDRGQMAAGQSVFYEMTSDPNTLLMLAVVEAAELTTPLSIQIIDPNGVVVVSTPPALGKAVAIATPALVGVYTVSVKNGGFAPATYKTTLVGKRIWF